MERVLVVGSGGAGKSTFARALGARTGLPVIYLDAEYWRPGWIEPSEPEWAAQLAPLLARDRWIMDGNFSSTLGSRLARADTVYFLDLPRTVCLWRVVTRSLKYRGKVRPSLSAGCPERVSLEFARWVWDYPRRSRPRVEAALASAGHCRVHRLRSRRAVRAALAAV